MSNCKNCINGIQCVMCHFQDILDAHDRVESVVLEPVVKAPCVSSDGFVSTNLQDLKGYGIEYWLRPNGDIIKFKNGHAGLSGLPKDESKTQLIA